MSTAAAHPSARPSGLRKLAYLSAVVGGGVVGSDYAKWMQVDPVIGTILGSLLSAALTRLLFHLRDDPGGKIKETCGQIGAMVGIVVGLSIAHADGGGAGPYGAGLLLGGFLGALAGQMVAAMLSLAALALLLISRGPIGFYLRNEVLAKEEATPSTATDGVEVLPEAMGCILPMLGL